MQLQMPCCAGSDKVVCRHALSIPPMAGSPKASLFFLFCNVKSLQSYAQVQQAALSGRGFTLHTTTSSFKLKGEKKEQ